MNPSKTPILRGLRSAGFLAAVLAAGFVAAQAEAASPSLGQVNPRGAQRGTSTELYFDGARLTDAQEILFYSPGVEVTKLEVESDSRVKASVTITADCRLGEHAVRVRTATGISELRTVYIGAFPAVAEAEPNNDFAVPQPVPLEATVTGVADNEDVDYYAVELKKGQRLSAEIEGMRLANTVFDPYVAILDARRFEMSACDDSALVWQDSVAQVVAPDDGTYVVMVRESAYAGNGACQYRLHLGSFPRPRAVFPAGGKIGEAIDVRYLADVSGDLAESLTLPAALDARYQLFPRDGLGTAPSGHVFRLSEVGNVIESEPNNTHDQSTPGDVPMAFNGIISEPGDVDCFRFKAKPGVTYDVHCYARRIRTPLDPVVTIDAFQGGGIVVNDDSGGPDSFFRFSPPEEKEYVLRVFDHLTNGGPDYVYRVEVTPVKPSLTLSIPKVALFSQERQTVPVPRGNRYATLIAASRADFGGELVLSAEGLPAGVTMQSENMPANLSAIPVLFEAAADAPLSGSMSQLIGRHADPQQQIAGGFTHTVELVTGGPGQSVYWTNTVDRLAAAVTEEVPFKISIVEPQVPLVQNGSMNLRVVAERKEGFTAPISVFMLFNPPGVGSASGATIPEGQNEVLYPINANGGAECRKWKIAVIAQANVASGPVWVSSQLATLEVTPPYVAFAMQRAAVEQGKPTEIVCQISHTTAFDGNAKAVLVGLPNKVTAPEMEFNKDAKELVFPVSTDAASPAGRHQNIFAQIVIVANGEPIVHNVGGTELQIDVPLPPKPNEPPPMPAAAPASMPEAAPPPPPEKRLTRLEKLRLEAEERKKAAPSSPQPPQE
jgi:hypothetical protein